MEKMKCRDEVKSFTAYTVDLKYIDGRKENFPVTYRVGDYVIFENEILQIKRLAKDSSGDPVALLSNGETWELTLIDKIIKIITDRDLFYSNIN